MAKDGLKIERQVATPGFAFLRAPDGVVSSGFDGAEYHVDKDGCVEVPVAAVADLTSHGFTALEG